MSKAGIQSNRGDGYQTLIAFDWALTVLDDPEFEWIEVDAATLPVDDVVIGKKDGSKICCQCKKNQPSHEAWSLSDLADELQKVNQLLVSDPKASVKFYSRSPFGKLESLREFSTNYADEHDYQNYLGKATGATNTQLKTLLDKQQSGLSTYDFLRRTSFETSPALDRIETLLRERLRRMASNPDAAFNALWTRLDHLGMRADSQDGQNAAVQHRLTKADLESILHKAGSMLAVPMDLNLVRSSFESTSSIGRKWCKDIAGETVSTPLVAEIMAAIDAKPSSILLTGQPGSGKTCVMLALQEALEQENPSLSNRFPIFIQSREFADMDTAQDRQAQGLPLDWIERVARMADTTHVIVVIDSLDVLSIAREHKVLGYFLAQIDRLLQLSNVTVITACRDFDRQYDRQIAQRKWSKEFKCQPFNWETEVTPLLVRHGIDASAVDETTRQLICNPRELALYVELASQGGSFNVVTSQALAKKYLQTFVEKNDALGSSAMRAIEGIATEMLRLRSLSVPTQILTTSDVVRHSLLSHNVLLETQDGKLTFGHQTLLDVLVISDALRKRKTLHSFIEDLPPVPFVRPSIRSFVAQLATGDRRDFRKQLRTVLTGTHAFHIRRLVAECLAGQTPQDDDWPLIRDLKAQQPDVFQVVYFRAVNVAWHHFWVKHLVPTLTYSRDSEALARHARYIAQWISADAQGVVSFWIEALSHDWVDRDLVGRQITTSLHDFDMAHAALLAPVLKILLQMSREEHSFLGHALARCVAAGGVGDAVLWHYIVCDIKEEDVLAYHRGGKLHCQPHEFGGSDENFLSQRMKQSPALLNLAVDTVEQWASARRASRSSFLDETSYGDAHSQTEMHHIDATRVLWDAIEAGIVANAQTHSAWWLANRERLCGNEEPALRYFAILACTASPEKNLLAIRRLLCNGNNLASDLSYELGNLIHHAFILLDEPTQAAIQQAISSIDKRHAADPARRVWMLQAQAQLILPIPTHLRTPAARAIIVECEQHTWPLLRQPFIGTRGGMVTAPFSYEIFLAASDDGVLRLLTHYDGYDRDSWDDFSLGGDAQVGGQLREASSRSAGRFMNLLAAEWTAVPGRFRNDILDGARTYLARRYGNLQASNWTPVDEPDAPTLARKILDALESHPTYWGHCRGAASALEACAHVVKDTPTAARVVALAHPFLMLHEESTVTGDGLDLLNHGINMATGNVADALMILATQLRKHSAPWPASLESALWEIAGAPHAAVRAVVLLRLPYLQHLVPDIGWKMFRRAMQSDADGLWKMAEPCLYYAYRQQFERVGTWLEHLYREGKGKDLETWGRIAALAAMSNRIDSSAMLESLKALDNESAWCGATSVWTQPSNIQQCSGHCFKGLETGLDSANTFATTVARKVCRVFDDTVSFVNIPISIVQRCFSMLGGSTEKSRIDLHGIGSWLNTTSLRDPAHALEIAEMYLTLMRNTNSYIYDHENNFTQLLTRLFAQAEEQEEADSGAMLLRVVALQDALMALGMQSINDWLKAIERL